MSSIWTSVSSPFYKIDDSPISYEGDKALARKQMIRTAWWVYVTVMAALTIGFLLEGLFAIATGSFMEGVVSALFGLMLGVALMFTIRIGDSAGFAMSEERRPWRRRRR